jgi:hypothetical protein
LSHQDEQGLTAADYFAVILVLSDQIKRFLDGAWSEVVEILYHSSLLSIKSSMFSIHFELFGNSGGFSTANLPLPRGRVRL